MAKGQLVAEGTYQWESDGANIGRETWQISQLGHGGIIIASRAEYTSPSPWNWNFTFEVDRAWSPVSLSVRVEREGHTITTMQRATGDRWVAQVQTGGETTTHELPFSNQHEVDFGSPLFNTVTLLRTRLPVGGSRELDVIYIPESLVPTAERQLYECLSEDKTQVPAGSYPGYKYRMTYPGREGGRVNDIWADRHGIVTDYQSRNGELIEFKLARYRRIERR